jgi:hypothetical protein
LRTCFAAGATADLRCPLPSDEFVPGSLKGQLEGNVADKMTVDVDTTGAGVFDMSGTVAFVGTYRKLDFNNVASTQHGTVQIPLDSTTYVKPIDVQWTVSQ